MTWNHSETNAGLGVFWLREDKRGHLECAAGCAPTPESLLPALQAIAAGVDPACLATLASRILASPPGPTEIHLPYISHRDSKRRDLILSRTEFKPVGSRLLPAAYLEAPALKARYEARLFSAGAFQPGNLATLEFVDGPLRSAIPAGWAAAWRTVPPENRAGYSRVWRKVSTAIQQLFRHVLQERWLRALDNCDRLQETCALLAYAASRPFSTYSRTEFTYDVLKPGWFKAAFNVGSRRLAVSLRETATALKRAGRHDLAALYRGMDARVILRKLRARPHPVAKIFVVEARIIDKLLSFGVAADYAADTRALANQLNEFRSELEARLRRLCRLDLSDTFPLVIIEATRALAASFHASPIPPERRSPSQHPGLQCPPSNWPAALSPDSPAEPIRPDPSAQTEPPPASLPPPPGA